MLPPTALILAWQIGLRSKLGGHSIRTPERLRRPAKHIATSCVSFPSTEHMARHRKHHDAFTIVELLIASTITVVIVVMLGTMFGSITKTISRAGQRTDAFRDARAALRMIERDLRGLVHATSAAY